MLLEENALLMQRALDMKKHCSPIVLNILLILIRLKNQLVLDKVLFVHIFRRYYRQTDIV